MSGCKGENPDDLASFRVTGHKNLEYRTITAWYGRKRLFKIEERGKLGSFSFMSIKQGAMIACWNLLEHQLACCLERPEFLKLMLKPRTRSEQDCALLCHLGDSAQIDQAVGARLQICERDR